MPCGRVTRKRDCLCKKLHSLGLEWIATGSLGVNNLEKYGRWAFIEFTDVFAMQHDVAKKGEEQFNDMIKIVVTR